MSKGQVLLNGATLLVVTATAFSLKLPDPYWWLVPVFLLFAYQGVIVWGVLDLSLSMFTPSICRIRTSEPVVALTFDDGPDPLSTPLVLEALSAAGVQATFFVVGRKVERYPELVRAIAAAGHEVAVHSYGHELNYSFLSPRFVRDDIRRCQELLQECGVEASPFFRPPVGQASPRTARGIAEAGVSCIGWSVRGGDGVARRTKDDCIHRLKKGIEAGAIVLLHDAWQGRDLSQELPETASSEERRSHSPAGVQALPELLQHLKNRGFSCMTVGDLLERQPMARRTSRLLA